jgi:S-DNA-T family DNA segregation ATPase FtsK/SpoIIIE
MEGRPTVASDAMTLVGIGLFFNSLAPWMGVVSYGNYMVIGGVGLILYEAWANHKGKFEKLFLNCGLFINTGKDKLLPQLMKKQKYETKTEYVFTLPPGLTLSDFRKNHEAIRQNLRKPISFEYRNGVIIMTVKEELKKFYKFRLIHCDNPMQVCFAIGQEGPVIFDIEEAVHSLIGGSTGWGKSVLMRSLITAILMDKKPTDLELHLVDFQRVELGIFKEHGMVKSFCSSPSQFSDLMDDIEEISEQRLDMFEKNHIAGIKSWNKKHKKLPYIVVIVDEFAKLSEKQWKKVMAKFQQRSALDRKVGVHYIICTQRCSVDVVNGTIKNNIQTRISLRLSSETDSRVVLDEGGAENLRYPGRCLIKTNELTECQVMYLSEDEAREAVYGKATTDTD